MRRSRFRLSLYMAFLLIVMQCSSPVFIFSLETDLRLSASLKVRVLPYHKNRVTISNKHSQNIDLSCFILSAVLGFIATIVPPWVTFIIYLAGDVHPNPGPVNNLDHSTSSTDIYSFFNLPHHLFTVHYNVQSLKNKIGILYTEFSQFDVITFSETWLNDNCPTNELLFPSFQYPERKDRTHDRYGGVIVYIKNNLSFISGDQILNQMVLNVFGSNLCLVTKNKSCLEHSIVHQTLTRHIPP